MFDWSEFETKLNANYVAGMERIGSCPPAERDARRAYLSKQREGMLERARPMAPRIFVSSNDDGMKYLTKAVAKLKNTHVSRLDPDRGKFKTINGYQERTDKFDRKVSANVIEHISLKISACSLYFGIITGEYEAEDGMTVPGPWPMFEAGIAASMGIPVLLLVESSVDENYWRKIFDKERHYAFSESNFAIALQICADRFQDEYNKILTRID